MSSERDNTFYLPVVVSDTAPDVYVTGAWANLDANGNLVVYLYHDMPQIPSRFIINTNARGQAVGDQPDISESPQYSFVRKVVVRATIPLNQAQVLGTWLADQANKGMTAVEELTADASFQTPNKRPDEG